MSLTTESTFEDTARELQADLDARTVRRAYAESRGPSNLTQAYQLQRALRKVREARGEKVVGFKIGFTSPTVRKNAATVMGLSDPVHGYLWDSEAYPDGAIVDHRRFGIEGELAVTLLSVEGNDVSLWEVEYQPIIEVHMMGLTASNMWDGPADDNNGRRGLELIGTNCVHAGVVHCARKIRGLLGEVPLQSLMTVHIDGKQIEQASLSELEVGGVQGPVGTITWLLNTLRAEGNGEESLIREGTTLLCSTPGGLYPVPPGGRVTVEFEGLTTTCVADT